MVMVMFEVMTMVVLGVMAAMIMVVGCEVTIQKQRDSMSPYRGTTILFDYLPVVTVVAAARPPSNPLSCVSEDETAAEVLAVAVVALALVSAASNGPLSKLWISMTTMRSKNSTSSGG